MQDFPDRGPADQPGAHGKDVRVVVFHALVGRVHVMAQGAADAGDLVGGHDGPHARAADEHSPLGLAGLNQPAGGPRDVGEVNGRLAWRASVYDLVAKFLQHIFDEFLEGEAGVIVAECDFQWVSLGRDDG